MIKLDVVLVAMEMSSTETTFFLDLDTGESICLSDNFFDAFDSEITADEIDENPARFLPLPTQFEINEYNIMEEFIWSLDGIIADKLAQTIQGRGAFRRFKDKVYDYGIEQQWFDFRENKFKEIAIEWCQSNKVAYEV
ncbi:hypothetical protein IGI37_002530 [Enterococcus sp. AZ194]|uniref:UPF0158 family protein n=1 Tax=Enterococcus sp. AZ194 TaxID=2774629 RepID=UPI003F1FDDBA